MRERYTYEIDAYEPGTGHHDGDWRSVVVGDNTFSREPTAIARGLLENWVIERPHELHGGERLQITHPRRRPPPPLAYPRLRVRVFRGAQNVHDEDAAAVGYLGHDARDFGGAEAGSDDEGGDRLRQLGTSAVRLTKDRRVGAGVATVLAIAAGFVTRRTLRGRGRGGAKQPRKSRGSITTARRPRRATSRRPKRGSSRRPGSAISRRG